MPFVEAEAREAEPVLLSKGHQKIQRSKRLGRRVAQIGGPLLIALLASACVPGAGAPPTEDAAAKKAPATTSTTVKPAPTTTTTVAPPPTTTPTTAPRTATPPPTSSLPAFGAQFHATWSDYTDAQRALVLDRLQAAGAKWVRIDVGWRTIEPDTSGGIASWYLRLVDYSVDQARSRGINVILTVLDTPAWASGTTDKTVPPRNPADYGRIMGWLATHFKGRVGAYEVWNEADSTGFFSGTPAQYVAMMKSAYASVKAADSAALVVGGATVYNNDAFLSSVYAAGGKGSFDVWSTHPYMGKADSPPETPDDGHVWIMDHVKAVRALMVANGDSNKPIWFTEFGWSSHATAPGADPWKLGVTDAQQADYLVRTMKFVQSKHPYVTVVIWYNERNKATGDLQEDNYGLMTRDFQPKPVYNSIKTFLVG